MKFSPAGWRYHWPSVISNSFLTTRFCTETRQDRGGFSKNSGDPKRQHGSLRDGGSRGSPNAAPQLHASPRPSEQSQPPFHINTGASPLAGPDVALRIQTPGGRQGTGVFSPSEHTIPKHLPRDATRFQALAHLSCCSLPLLLAPPSDAAFAPPKRRGGRRWKIGDLKSRFLWAH